MAFKKRTGVASSDGATGSVTIGLGASYGRLCQFKITNAGTDTSMDYTITDADGYIAFTVSAADKVGAAATINILGTDDSTTPSATVIGVMDATGIEGSAGSGGQPILRSPVTCAYAADAGAAFNAVVTFDLYVEV